MRLITIIYAVYGGISLLLYASLFGIIVALRQNNLCRAFSKLILLYSIVNIISYTNSWFSHRMRVEPIMWPIYESLNVVSLVKFIDRMEIQSFDSLRNFLTFIMPWTNYNQSVCNLLFAINRFTAISFPLRHRNFWDRFISHTILCSVAFGSICACSRLPMFTIWKYSANDSTYFIQHQINLNAFWYQIGFCSVLLALCTVLNIISIVRLKKIGGSHPLKEIERSFLFVALCTFIAECCNVFMLTGKQISQASDYTNLWMAFNAGSPFVTDVCSLGLPYYLLIIKDNAAYEQTKEAVNHVSNELDKARKTSDANANAAYEGVKGTLEWAGDAVHNTVESVADGVRGVVQGITDSEPGKAVKQAVDNAGKSLRGLTENHTEHHTVANH